MQDVCVLMLNAKLRVNQDLRSSAITQHNLADYVVRVALQKGTRDNVAAVVVPLGPPSSGTTLEDWSQFEENLKTSISPLQNIPYQLNPGTLTDHLLYLLIYCNYSLVLCVSVCSCTFIHNLVLTSHKGP